MNQRNQKNYRQKGIISNKGFLYKGKNNNSFFKTCVSSIPSNYQTIIFKNNTIKAFNTSALRFQNKSQSLNPGPGNYNCNYDIYNRISKQSISKRGFGLMINRSQRKLFQKKYVKQGPGPGFYKNCIKNTQRSLSLVKKKQIKSQKYKNYKQKQNIIVGPGSYNLQPIQKKKIPSYTFISKTQKLIKTQQSNDLSYNIFHCSLYIPKNYQKGHSAVFKKPLDLYKKYKQKNMFMQKILDKHIQKQQQGRRGYYQHKFPNFKPQTTQISFRNKQGFSIDLIKKINGKYKQSSGAGHQQCTKEIIKEKNNNSSCFLSKTDRSKLNQQQKLGPSLYNLSKQINKKSFLLNYSKKWV